MRRLVAVIAVLSLSALVWGAEEGKPNALTPQEIADGWLLLFDGETTFGWHSPNDSHWTIAEGMLAPQADKPGLLVTNTTFADYELRVDYRMRPDSRVEVRVAADPDGQVRAPQSTMMLRFMGSDWARLEARVRGGNVESQAITFPRRGFATKSPAVRPKQEEHRSGHLALSGNGVVFRSIKLKPLGTKSLFNGKDLAGWKKFEGDKGRAKSAFTVTKEGWLNLKDGPGDLQTEGQWADLVLQLECISNGKHLNSGVFFRCRPGEYQQGYEAQVRNQFTAEPTQEYTLEEYDAQTHELKDTKKVKYTAVDYGTGGIYRRQPARREVAKDHEWFTMTVAAHGRHVAVWVNGYPVTDWTDNRKEADNARNGCRLEKGAISLQGHDKTTDLSFRNLRIADLAAPEGEKRP